MSAEMQVIFAIFLCFLFNFSNYIFSMPHVASVKWDYLGFLLFGYKQIVTEG